MKVGNIGVATHAKRTDLSSDPDLLPDRKSGDSVKVSVERMYLSYPLAIDQRRLRQIVPKNDIVPET